ncbi:hypothetical protein Tco_0301103 [Tanacetum coccineum]
MMADNRIMAQMLEAPTVGYEGAIIVPEITADNFELKHGLLTLVQNKQFFRHDKEDPHAHIRYFNKITSTMKFPNVPSTSVKLMLFPFSLEGAAWIWIEKEPPRSILTWDDLACPHHGFSELHQLDTFYNALNSNDQDSLNSAAGGNFLDKMPRDCLRIIESKSKVRNSRNKPVVAKVSASSSTPGISPDVVELKDMVKALLLDKKSQAPAPMKAVEKSCVTCGGTHSYRNCPANDGNVYRDNIFKRPTIPTTFSSPPKVVERETEMTKDMVPPTNNGSTKDVQPLVVQDQSQVPNSEPVVTPVVALMPNPKSSILYPSRRNDERRREKANDQIEKFYEIFKDLSFEISLTDALILMPKFASTLKALIGNKEKLSKMARTPLNEHCSAGYPRQTGRALIDVYKGELTLRVGKEAITFNLDQNSRYSSNYNDNLINRIDVIEMACEEYSQEVLGFSNVITSGNPTPYYDPIVSTSSLTLTPIGDSDFLLLEEADAFLALEDDPTSLEVDDSYYDSNGDILLLK